ncbi:P-loop NTPase [Paragemmobacter ruber]|uniref:Novel STAND NTPase 5 domain-containing protein n=1 Tax=Paragemmobacter ruber TaxID=1985673 RepID=A0ABW9YB50_9RHOB|nr:SIR2 family protein [Rhodobacter ruber]NBE09672.1 hypothetical protein [Rhodobacter ruber]
MAFASISANQEKSLVDAVIAGSYTLLLGAGASHDSSNALGRLPLGSTLLKELAQLTGAPEDSSLQRVFKLLSPDQIEEHVTRRLSNSKPGATALGISSFNWRQIFTFNIDDSLEAAYIENKRQKLHPIHFADPFESFQTSADLPLIYLHGTVKNPEKGYVFSRDQYIKIIKAQNPWMVFLSAALRSEPVIISGASMDEVDLEYYLAFRDEVSVRDDVPPSVYVSSDDGVITRSLCKEHGLIHFKGYSADFIQYLKTKIPAPPLIEDRIPAGIREILPAVVDRTAAMQFDADFELVPRLPSLETGSNKFYYGSPPTWPDLAAQLDIPRHEVAPIVAEVSGAPQGREIIVILGGTGTGKTAILRRVAYSLASFGQAHVLWASELGRMSKSTASTLDAIDGSVVLVVDNFADHAQSIADLLSRAERDDLTIIGGERSYRRHYIDRTFGSKGYTTVEIDPLRNIDVERLVQKLSDRMLVGSHLALKGDRSFFGSLRSDPVAVATCRILNDFRPLSKIITGLINSATSEQLEAFLSVAVCAHCFKGGVRLSILSTTADSETLRTLLSSAAGLSLRYVDPGKNYVTVENSTIADEILFALTRTNPSALLRAFVGIANAVAPFVNRSAIRARSPEARLAGRLFDFDDVVEKFLGDLAPDFYESTKEAWRWNSRYWEQTALLRLSQSERVSGESQSELLGESLQNARYSVAIEEHPFGLTTLGKVLMYLQSIYSGDRVYFEEGYECLLKAISLEDKLGRVTIHPYVTLIIGCNSFLDRGGRLTAVEAHNVRRICDQAMRRWPAEIELSDACKRIMGAT